MKKIILSTYTFLPDIGGVATNTLTIAKAFISKGYDVTVVTLTEEHCEYDDSMKIVRNPSLLQLFILYWKADWVLFSNLSIKLCWPALLMQKEFALHHHSSSAFKCVNKRGLGSKIKKIIESHVILKSIHFVNSEFTKKDGGTFFDKLTTYITYPIAQNTNICSDIHNDFSVKTNALFVGRIEDNKGVPFLLDNFELIKEHLNIELLFLAGDGSLLKSLKNEKIKGVNFVGAVDLSTVNNMMVKSAYVFVPSVWKEPFGMVAVEGLASGSIVISSDRGGLPEAVGNNAILFNMDSQDSFIAALKRAKKTRDHCQNCSDNLSNYVHSVNSHIASFSANNVIEIIIDALNKETLK